MGDLKPGSVASLSILDVRQPWEVKGSEIRSRAGWSPYEGRLLPGKVIETVLRGVRWDATTIEIIAQDRGSCD
jgi:dihydroorotase-like cyclic amidohydrolase